MFSGNSNVEKNIRKSHLALHSSVIWQYRGVEKLANVSGAILTKTAKVVASPDCAISKEILWEVFEVVCSFLVYVWHSFLYFITDVLYRFKFSSLYIYIFFLFLFFVCVKING